jgi:nifR3 family TIM-barrel protein
MDGVTDAPFRRLCRVLSGNRMGLLVSEFVPTDGDAVFRLDGHKQLKFFPEERPFGVQIFGRFPDKMAEAARKIAVELHPDFVEVNAGCPAPKVAGKGSGSGLLRDLPRLQEILHEVRSALDSSCPEMPLTLKCRIGWDSESINVMETLKIAEGEGVEMLTVHGRTRLQGYNGLADWNWIGKVAAAAKIPVIGNGDVNSVATARKCIDDYGVAGVSIGRGAMHNPWLFGQIADAWEGLESKEISATEALDVFPLYYKFKLEDGSTELGAMGRLKQLAARLCKGFVLDGADDATMQVRQSLLTAQTAEEFFDRLQELREGMAKALRYDPSRLVNLNGAKETEIREGDQFS